MSQPLIGRCQRALDQLDATDVDRRERLEQHATRFFSSQGDRESERREDFRRLTQLAELRALRDLLSDQDMAEAFAVLAGDERLRTAFGESIRQNNPELAHEYDLDDVSEFVAAVEAYCVTNESLWEEERESIRADAGFPLAMIELAAINAEVKVHRQFYEDYLQMKMPEKLRRAMKRVESLRMRSEALHKQNAERLAALDAAREPDGMAKQEDAPNGSAANDGETSSASKASAGTVDERAPPITSSSPEASSPSASPTALPEKDTLQTPNVERERRART